MRELDDLGKMQIRGWEVVLRRASQAGWRLLEGDQRAMRLCCMVMIAHDLGQICK